MSKQGSRLSPPQSETTRFSISFEDSQPEDPLGLTILHHPELQRVGEVADLSALDEGRVVKVSRIEPSFSPPREQGHRALDDRRLSRKPWTLRSAKAGGLRLFRSETPTRMAVNGQPVHDERTISAEELSRGVVLTLGNRVVLLLHSMDTRFESSLPRFGWIGEGAATNRLRREVRRVCELDVPVLLRGPTGSGKELVAKALHFAGPRNNHPFLTINMGAIPASLAASELFGAESGAFTGAGQRRLGYFRQADRGTLFLDEIGEIPNEVQPLLLRALESGEIQPVGGGTTTEVDVRFLAATDSDLEQAVEAGTLRAPLLHRLATYEIHVPSLQERREDIGRLLVHFLRQEMIACRGDDRRLDDPGPDAQPWLPAKLVAALAAFDWPGNVRQLRNVARRLVIGYHDAPHAKLDTRLRSLLESPEEQASSSRRRRPREISQEELAEAMRISRWHPGTCAKSLGISRSSLYLLIDRYPGIRKASELSREDIEQAQDQCQGNWDAMVDHLEVSIDGLRRRMKQLGIGEF